MTTDTSSAKTLPLPEGKYKMRKSLRNLAAAAAVAALPVAGTAAAPAWAHAVIISSNPTDEQHVAAGKLAIRIEFNSRIDKARSRLQLIAPAGDKVDVPIDPTGDPNIVAGTTNALTPGAYVLRWQVLAIDGDITRGDIPFTVDH
jgi:copper resistance protein C